MKAMLSRRHREKRRTGLSMAPMVDIVFQLLIFFLVATEMRPKEADFKMDLPGGRGAVRARVDLYGDDSGEGVRVALNGADLGWMRAAKTDDVLEGQAFAELETRLRRAAGVSGEKLMVVIHADPAMRMKFVAGAVDAAAGAEVPRVIFGASRTR